MDCPLAAREGWRRVLLGLVVPRAEQAVSGHCSRQDLPLPIGPFHHKGSLGEQDVEGHHKAESRVIRQGLLALGHAFLMGKAEQELAQPTDPAAYQNRGRLRNWTGDQVGALADAKRALALDPKDNFIHAEGCASFRRGLSLSSLQDVQQEATPTLDPAYLKVCR
jgi:hypothetical protein